MASSDSSDPKADALKQEAEADLDSLLQTWERRPHEPDLWERLHFKNAIDRLASGKRHRYHGIAVDIEYALVPPAKCAPKLQPTPRPELDRLDLAMMRREFTSAKAVPTG
jgi:hypothetical protein